MLDETLLIYFNYINVWMLSLALVTFGFDFDIEENYNM
jgi:hypothetical protein